jgi:SAM-dependent methyltransferase
VRGARPSPAARLWRQVSAADYDGHMGHAAVDQSRLLADLLAEAAARWGPRRILIPGAATGNGLERLHGLSLERVTTVDVVPAYLECLRARHTGALAGLEIIQADLEAWEPDPVAYDLVWCALVLEYVEPGPLLKRLARSLAPGGHLRLVLQRPAEGHGRVSETPFLGVRILEPAITLRDPVEVAREARRAGLERVEERTVHSSAGKPFHLSDWRRPC